MKQEGRGRQAWHQRFRDAWKSFLKVHRISFSADPVEKEIQHESVLRRFSGRFECERSRNSHKARMVRRRRSRERMAKRLRRINYGLL